MAMGGLDQVDMAFSGIRMELNTGKKKKKKGSNGDETTTRVVLDGSIRGRAQPGRMVAIMGPSGAVRYFCWMDGSMAFLDLMK
jgi:hypothetical protein